MADLSPKQLAFCKEYLKDFNAGKAAIRAGYSENGARQQGHKLLTKADVQSYLAKVFEQAGEEVGYTAQQLLQDIRDVHARVKENLMEDAEPDHQLINAFARLCELLGKHITIGAFKEVHEHNHKVDHAAHLEAAMEKARKRRAEIEKKLH